MPKIPGADIAGVEEQRRSLELAKRIILCSGYGIGFDSGLAHVGSYCFLE